MKNKDEIMLIIKDLKSNIQKRYKVKELGLFGSVYSLVSPYMKG